MVQAPRILVVLMTDKPEKDDHVVRYGMNVSCFEAIRRAGGIPVPLQPGPEAETRALLSDLLRADGTGLTVDGICLPGGGDIEPRFYGRSRRPWCGQVDEERDLTELHLMRLVRDSAIPLFGICRGMQVVNVAFGGTLVQDIAKERPEAMKHALCKDHPRDHLAHSVTIAESSLLRGIVGEERIEVNSLHHQALDTVGEGLRPTAWAPDGTIEALELERSEGRFFLAVQWHPEDLPSQEHARRLFEAFVSASGRYRMERMGRD